MKENSLEKKVVLKKEATQTHLEAHLFDVLTNEAFSYFIGTLGTL